MADPRSEIEQEMLVKQQEEKTIIHARNFSKLALVFEVSALVMTILGVVVAVIFLARAGGGSVAVAIGLLSLMAGAAAGATLWAAARGMRLFGEYVAIRVWRAPRQMTPADSQSNQSRQPVASVPHS